MFNLIKKFFLVKEIKSKEGVLHFLRYRVIECSLFSIYIHYIAKSDEDKNPHSHPWSFWSLILFGGYYETLINRHTKEKQYFKKEFLSAGHRFYDDYHQISLIKPTWTLVFCSPRNENYTWGYLTEEGHVDHITYRINKNNEKQ